MEATQAHQICDSSLVLLELHLWTVKLDTVITKNVAKVFHVFIGWIHPVSLTLLLRSYKSSHVLGLSWPRISSYKFHLRHATARWCHQLHNPKPAISELGDYSGMTSLKWRKRKMPLVTWNLEKRKEKEGHQTYKSHSSSPREVDFSIHMIQFFCGHLKHI